MKRAEQRALGLTTLGLIALVALAILHYNGNLSVLLRIGKTFGEDAQVPPGIVLLDPRGYDGELYYQMTRNIPQFFFGEGIRDLPFYNNAYRWQRILLPALAYSLSLGHEAAIPSVITIVNIFAIVLALLLAMRICGRASIHALTIVGNPAALVGLLFALTEPLSLLFLTAFALRWKHKNWHLDGWQILFLSLSLLARETTLLLLALLLLWALWKKQWRDVALALVPLALFALWQYILYLRLGALPMANGAGMVDWRFAGILGLLSRTTRDPNAYVLSSICYLVFFVLPLFMVGLHGWIGEKKHSAPLFVLGGLTVALLSMKVALWGVLTSIGRVITPLYPLYLLVATQEDSKAFRLLSRNLIVISVVLALGVALQMHPYVISS